MFTAGFDYFRTSSHFECLYVAEMEVSVGCSMKLIDLAFSNRFICLIRLSEVLLLSQCISGRINVVPWPLWVKNVLYILPACSDEYNLPPCLSAITGWVNDADIVAKPNPKPGPNSNTNPVFEYLILLSLLKMPSLPVKELRKSVSSIWRCHGQQYGETFFRLPVPAFCFSEPLLTACMNLLKTSSDFVLPLKCQTSMTDCTCGLDVCICCWQLKLV